MFTRIIADGPSKKLKHWMREALPDFYPGNRANHVKQVKDLSFQLFFETQRLGLTSGDKAATNILYAAALLHDVGYVTGVGDVIHEVFSLLTILSLDIPVLDEKQKTMAALVAYYHRSSALDEINARFAALSHADQETVRLLSAILKVADVLDRDHRQQVKRIELTRMGDTLKLVVFVNKKKKYDYAWSPFENMHSGFLPRFEQKSLPMQRMFGQPLHIDFRQE